MMPAMAEENLLVLVADDEPSMREMVADHLKQIDDLRLDVIVAENGEQALLLARERLPDLVVLDVMMPEMSGWEVCKRIREDVSLAHTAVLMLTGIGEKVNELTSPLYGADAHIDKPFEFIDLDDKVRETLAARAAQRAGIPHVNGTAGAAEPAPEAGPGPVKAKPKAAAKAKAKKAAPKAKAKAKAAPKAKAKAAPKAKAKAKKAAPKAKAKKAAPKAKAKKAAPKAKAKAKAKATPKKKAKKAKKRGKR
jgi:DNA-binding response OmpR family regulator